MDGDDEKMCRGKGTIRLKAKVTMEMKNIKIR